eukprot:TRINITY_DN780_c0_g1_i3.p1 TRINITY_DN780_c0_g1~~TRINITY_DN780_c0_g1_i3.p1  ORF type:complete len:122 (+),score=23.65 TRINITY_DN780_c0_g1_i3:53-418(+)
MSKLEELATLITPKTYQITPKQALLITKTLQISDDEFLRLLAKFGLDRAYAPISGFHVGSAAVTVEGAYFIGNNMEFLGLPLSAAIHSEQFLISNVLGNRGTILKTVAITHSPCGHCRQFF